MKHTFLFTLLLGLGWVGFLFGYSMGPDPGVNGIFGPTQTCAQAGCHFGNVVNANGGSLTLAGLPGGGWTPGQTYPLTIMVQRTGQSRFGFQLSAVADATNQQAGTLARIAGNVFVITNAGIQYIEHSNATNINTFTVNWTAPSSAAVGTVRFNLAGNAANGDFSNQGDFIYTRVDRVSPASAPPPVDNTFKAYTLVNRGGMSVITDGSGDLITGYARIQPDSGQTTPAGVAIFGGRTNGVLVAETGVPASPALTTGRIYAEVAGVVSTGFAIANPTSSPATFNFSYTNTAGTDLGSGTTTIPANGQITRFLHEAPFNTFGASTFQGTFSFTSSVPVGVIALRSYINERGDFLMSTLPVINTSVAAATGTQIIPHFADGGGWITQILLVNPTDTPMDGLLQFYDDSGSPVTVTIANQLNSSFSYSVPRRSSQKFATSNPPLLQVGGSVRVMPAGDGPVPIPLIVFSYKPSGVVLSEAGVPTTSGTAFRMYVESSGTDGRPGNIQSGIAVANSGFSSTTVSFELTNLDGSSSGLPVANVNVPARGHTGKFLAQIFPTLPASFKGVLKISTVLNSISVVGLRARYNELGSFLITTTPTTIENIPAPTGEYLFPDLANGGGYTTQFILFSGYQDQAAGGNIRFFKPDGSPLGLNLN
ncbi:MAG TPA: choice-of-anchor V domain-containing protein [Terriglobia bacterium]|nr:choice-of-anchor V domain-containing protein [Terriglobia bacterium]